jgi:hypothetical protein
LNFLFLYCFSDLYIDILKKKLDWKSGGFGLP